MKNLSEKIIKNDLKTLLQKFLKDDSIDSLLKFEDQETVKVVPLKDVIDNEYIKEAKIPPEKINLSRKNIENTGVISPLIVRKKNKKYEVIIGRVQYLAAKEINEAEIPIIEVALSDEETLLLLLAEIHQRRIINFYELSLACFALKNEFNYKNKDLASYLNQSESQISNLLEILKTPNEIKEDISLGKLSYGHAKAICRLDKEDSLLIRNKIHDNHLSVRETEALVRELKKGPIERNKESIKVKELSLTLEFANQKDLDKTLERINKLIKRKKITLK